VLPFLRYWCLKLENGWIFPPHPSFRSPLGGNRLEFCDEIWHQKTRIVGLPDGEGIMMLAFFILTQYRCVTDRRTDTLLSQRPTIALRRTGKNGNNQTISYDILIRHIWPLVWDYEVTHQRTQPVVILILWEYATKCIIFCKSHSFLPSFREATVLRVTHDKTRLILAQRISRNNNLIDLLQVIANSKE